MGAYIALLDFPGLIFKSPSVSKLWMVRVKNPKKACHFQRNIDQYSLRESA